MGRFNELLHIHEKLGGPVRPIRQILKSHEAINDCNLKDLGYEGHPFTWITTRHEGIKERLNRVLATLRWSSLFPKHSMQHLDPSKSDHSLVILHGEGLPIPGFEKNYHFSLRNFGSGTTVFLRLSEMLGSSLLLVFQCSRSFRRSMQLRLCYSSRATGNSITERGRSHKFAPNLALS